MCWPASQRKDYVTCLLLKMSTLFPQTAPKGISLSAPTPRWPATSFSLPLFSFPLSLLARPPPSPPHLLAPWRCGPPRFVPPLLAALPPHSGAPVASPRPPCGGGAPPPPPPLQSLPARGVRLPWCRRRLLNHPLRRGRRRRRLLLWIRRRRARLAGWCSPPPPTPMRRAWRRLCRPGGMTAVALVGGRGWCCARPVGPRALCALRGGACGARVTSALVRSQAGGRVAGQTGGWAGGARGGGGSGG